MVHRCTVPPLCPLWQWISNLKVNDGTRRLCLCVAFEKPASGVITISSDPKEHKRSIGFDDDADREQANALEPFYV